MTECNQSSFGFEGSGRREIVARFDGGTISSDGGAFLLRIEDTDAQRSEEAHTRGLIADLRWLGLDWDAGPDREDPRGPYRQSERAPIYASDFEALEKSATVYPCYCSALELEVSRRTQLASGKAPRYAGICRELTLEEPPRARPCPHAALSGALRPTH